MRIVIPATVLVAAVAIPVSVGLVIGPHLRAQTPSVADTTNLAFEVASVKPNPSGDRAGGFGRSPVGLTITNYSLLRLISNAYGVQEFQIVGGPRWMDTDRFDVVAKAPEGSHPSPQELFLMLQSLLADRFNLRVRRETKLGPTYSLVVARSDGTLGEHLRSGVDCAVAETSIRRDPDKCGMRYEFGAMHMRGMTLGPLLEMLKSLVRRPVIDRTGLTGGFDYDLKSDALSRGLLGDVADATAPSLFSALQEQLGLKLESQQGPVETLAIEHAEPPTPD
jgi:uncharacterized protein (TIGR03435 family)